jgi:uncharacterized protein YcfL
MKSRLKILAALAILSGPLGMAAYGAGDEPPASGGAASKVEVRGKQNGVKVIEMRVKHTDDIMVIQADFQNSSNKDRVIYYRFRWLDADGGQVGDNDAFKQLRFMGQAKQTLKGVAPNAKVKDFRIEMNVEVPK